MWSSLVMTPASHAGNPEFESRHVYIFLFAQLRYAFVSAAATRRAFDTLPEWLRGSPAK